MEPIKGKCVFGIETTPDGIKINTFLHSEEGELIPFPAIFPDLEYALSQIDELRRLVLVHFAEAAKAGMRVLGNEKAEQSELPSELLKEEKKILH